MQIVSVNVAMPASVSGTARGTVTSGIYKHAVDGPVDVHATNLAGDGQGDLENHGGPLKAIYVYASEDYDYWRQHEGLSIPEFGWFGENLTVAGAASNEVHVGDIWEVGSVRLQVTEPRSPCYKLDHKVGTPRFAARFQQSGRLGFYLRVLSEGSLGADTQVMLASSEPGAMTVRELSEYRYLGRGGRSMAARVLGLDHVGPEWQRRARRLMSGALEASDD